MSKVIEVDGSISKWISSTENRLVLIDFYATWCGPCKMLHPIYDSLSLKYPKVVFLRADGDRNRELCGQYGISGYPTVIFFYHGSEVDRVVGYNPDAIEEKINTYSLGVNSFQGTGLSLGGDAVDAEKAREMRLKRFENVKIHGTEMAAKTSSLYNRMKGNAADYEEEVVEKKESDNLDTSMDTSIRADLEGMGFSLNKIEKTLKECSSRDMGDLVTYITSLPDNNEETAPEYVCDGNECHLVPSASKRGLDERVAETKQMIEKKKKEKELQEKEEAKRKEKERIEKGKKDQESREQLERLQRQREAEHEKEEKRQLEEEKKRQLELWRKEHGITVVKEEKHEKPFEERVQLLVSAIAAQKIDNKGTVALSTLHTILKNTTKEDPKYRQLKKENTAFQKKVSTVPGALPLMIMAGFEEYDGVYLMKERDDVKLNTILTAIQKYVQ